MAGKVNAPKTNPSWMRQLFNMLYTTDAAGDRAAARTADVYKKMYNADIPTVDGSWNLDDPTTQAAMKTIFNEQSAAQAHPLKTNIEYTDAAGDTQTVNALANTLGIVGANVKAHPVYALGTAANAGANVAGLFDNDKWGGQAAGTVLGILANKGFGVSNPLLQANIAMAGGALGSLFDKLRAKKEQEQQMYGYNSY